MFATTPQDHMDVAFRRERAISLTKTLVQDLIELGVSVRIIGSLANGSFGPESDIDILVMECPYRLKYRIEAMVEDALDGFLFDVVYCDEIPPHRLARFTRESVDASDLH
ncbi:nucleotidyltransferase domain-containing protein [Rhizobium sp. CG5]|uniref:nucleotidyltransferase family protein n=1 Tax=Rhizobium sp. CG5 TaxID=2726076 RepID=UPI0020337118|nr:nucleotidyltransferase domain-containing protein [Rhizobium sp. CG5]